MKKQWHQAVLLLMLSDYLTRLYALDNFQLFESYNFQNFVSFHHSDNGDIAGAKQCRHQPVRDHTNRSYITDGLLALRAEESFIHGRFSMRESTFDDLDFIRVRLTFGAVSGSNRIFFEWDQWLTEQSAVFQPLPQSSSFGLQLTLDKLTDRLNYSHTFRRPGRYFLELGIESRLPGGSEAILDCMHLVFRLPKIQPPAYPRTHSFHWTPYNAVRFSDIWSYRTRGWKKKAMLYGADQCAQLTNPKGGLIRSGLMAVQTNDAYLHGYVQLVMDTEAVLNQTQFIFALGNGVNTVSVKQLLGESGDVLQLLSVHQRSGGNRRVAWVGWQLHYSEYLPVHALTGEASVGYNLDMSVRILADRSHRFGCYALRGFDLSSAAVSPVLRPVIVPPTTLGVYDWGEGDRNITRYAAPGLFEVLDIPAISSDKTSLTGSGEIGPFSFTVGEGPSNAIFSGAFEPMAFRYRFSALPMSSGNVFRADTSLVQQFSSGLFDGAEARVFRLVDGEVSLVRTSVVTRDVASGWEHVFLPDDGGYLFLPSVREIAMRLPSWHAFPSVNWFKVVAIEANGLESNGPYASVLLHYINNGDSTEYEVSTTTAGRPNIHYGNISSPVPSPTNLTARQDTVTGKIILAWEFDATVASAAGFEIIGFRFYRSDSDPALHEGWFLELEDDGGVDILPTDMAFVYHTRYSWSRIKYSNKRVYGTPEGTNPPMSPYFMNDETNGTRSWQYVAHPSPVPPQLAYEGGKTCIRVECLDNSDMDIRYAAYGHLQQHYYPVLGNATYRVEGWFRADPGQVVNMSFTLDILYNRADLFACVAALDVTFPWRFTFGDTWEFHQVNFTIPSDCVFEGPSGTGQAVWAWKGPNTIYMDNLRMYDASAAFGDWMPADYAEIRASKMQFVRTHMFIKSGFSYTMDSLTDVAGNMAQWGNVRSSVWTLHTLLISAVQADINPWIQLEMCMTDEEWLGFVEYMCASYDPAVDSPTSKPWAHKRYMRGAVDPWLTMFTTILFEFSNENWNYLFFPWTFANVEMADEVTGQRLANAALYGVFQERHIRLMKSSPHWTQEAEDKFVFVIGGWAAQNDGVEGYGQLAARFSPSSSMLTIAGYNGGWERSQVTTDTREGFLSALMLNAVILNREADHLTITQQQLRDMGVNVMLGTYEAGPGYNLNGLNGVVFSALQVESESLVLKSQAGGVATLETFLYRARLGWDMQNFFTFDRNRHYWVSHARAISGGYAYPPWSALTMYNKYAVGSFLVVNSVSSPISDFEGSEDVPLVAVYATKSGNGDQYSVFVISRKLDYFPFLEDDGTSNISLALPFYSADSIRLVKMDSPTGPTTTTLDSNAVVIEEEDIDCSETSLLSPVFHVSIPPGVAYLYVFSGVHMWASPVQRTVLIAPIRGVVAYPDVVVKFRVTFDRPWEGFSLDDISISGTAQASLEGVSVEADSWSKHTSYTVRVADMRAAGSVVLAVDQVSSEAFYVVWPAVPTAPVNAWAEVNPQTTKVTFHWRVEADIAQYPSTYILQWGPSPTSTTTFTTGELIAHDHCPRCQVCVSDASLFCSEANVTLNISDIYPTGATTYQAQHPIYFQIQALTAAGLSSPTFVSIYNILEDFDLPVIGLGALPDLWGCISNCDALSTVSGSTESVQSPSGSPLLQFMQDGMTSLIYMQSDTGAIGDKMIPFQFYTVSMLFGFRLPNGSSEFGILSHFVDASNWILVFVNPGAGIFRILGRRHNTPVYAASVQLIQSSPAVTDPTGYLWTMDVQVRPTHMYCGEAQEVLVKILDETGNCRIDFDSIVGAEYEVPSSHCVLGFSSCSFAGKAGTIGLYSNNAQQVGGHFVDSIAVTAKTLVP